MIFVVAGTSDGRNIISEFIKKGYNVIASMTTEFAGSLLSNSDNLKIITKKMLQSDFENEFIKNKIKIVVDASHPFATVVSRNVMEASKNADCKYIRYERETPDYLGTYKKIIEVNSFEEAVNFLCDKSGNIFLTIGSKELLKFTEVIDCKKLYPRVLPMSSMIKKCEDAGISISNIIGMKGPFSKELNIAMMKNINADFLVTKESGEAGGFMEKIEAAKHLGINVIVIKREKIEYPISVNSINEIIKYLEIHYEK